jgi:hypothetical protein
VPAFVPALRNPDGVSFQFAPVSGEILAVNEKLGSQPSLLNKSPEDEGAVSHHVSDSLSAHFCIRLAFPT